MKSIAKERNNSRLYTVQALYQRKISGITFDELKVQYFADNADRHATDWDYFYRIVDSVESNEEQILEYIEKNSKDGVVSINYVDLAVLQASIAELIECLETPFQVVIKEYVEIGYSMGTEEGYKFINAMLQKLSTVIRESE